MIDTSNLNKSMKGASFRYAEMVDINKQIPQSKTSIDPKHRILMMRSGKKPVVIGDENGAYDYDSKEAAQADVKKLNEWSKL